MRATRIALCAFALALTACPASLMEVCDDNACVAPEGGAVPPGCDLSKELAASPACIDELVGYFVSATGSDDATGTKKRPFATLGKALSQTGKARVYVCEGTYVGTPLVTKAVAIYGGLKCDFTPGGARPVIVGDSPDFAMRITASGVSLLDLVIQAKDAVTPSQSSVALAVVSSQNVELRRMKLVAGKGQPGADGVAAPYAFPAPSTLDGKPGTGTSGGLATTNACPGGASTGGKGGDNGLDGQAGQPSGAGGAAGTFAGCATNIAGGNGADGASFGPAASPTTLGTLGVSWSPSAGARGTDGAPGQGGGGGGGRGGGGGGGGGAGGCGGAGGPGGGGGGGSIALLALDSGIKLTASELVAGVAGRGGSGVAGQTGQTDFGAAGVPAAGGCNGGAGGKAGSGGAGAGGAGGISVGILHRGAAPSQDGTTITPGTKGAKGTGGAAGTNDGIDGLAQALLEVK